MMLAEMIENNKLEIFFQPIVSIKNKKVFAFEALLRGYDDEGQILSPVWLFDQARQEGLSLILDQLAHMKAIEKFKNYFDKNEKLLLFLNFESSSIDRDFDIKPCVIEDKLNELGIPFKNIVIEVKEDEIYNIGYLKDFCQYYKKLGFNIALDDFGTGNSSFDRLSVIAPSIVKIDRSIVSNIHNNYINTEILKAISKMCEKIGALVMAEGVESHEEVLECMNGGIDIYQGYWFARASRLFSGSDRIQQKIIDLSKDFFENRDRINESKANIFEQANDITNKFLNVCMSIEKDKKKKLTELINNEKNVEAVYMIDAKTSRQIGKTIMNVEPCGFYEPSIEGEDHSLKEYVYMVDISRHSSYITGQYISGASGNMCRTFSKKLILNEKEIIFCVDVYEKEKSIKICA